VGVRLAGDGALESAMVGKPDSPLLIVHRLGCQGTGFGRDCGARAGMLAGRQHFAVAFNKESQR
jgi:hypothetical protein